MKTKTYRLLNENVVVDTFLLYSFIKKLVTPFNQTDAYKLGLIDDQGKALKDRKELTSAERRAYSLFDVLVFNVKKLIEKLPFGKTRLASFAAALFLLKEQNHAEELSLDEDSLYELFMDFMEEVDINSNFREQLEKYLKDLDEDAPANSSAGGGIAGTTGDPVIRKKPKTVDPQSGRSLIPFLEVK